MGSPLICEGGVGEEGFCIRIAQLHISKRMLVSILNTMTSWQSAVVSSYNVLLSTEILHKQNSCRAHAISSIQI